MDSIFGSGKSCVRIFLAECYVIMPYICGYKLVRGPLYVHLQIFSLSFSSAVSGLGLGDGRFWFVIQTRVNSVADICSF